MVLGLVLWAVGLVTGVIASILGIGGGLMLVPILALMGLSASQAVGTSLVAVVMGAVSGSLQSWSVGKLDGWTILFLCFPAFLTVKLGVFLANVLPDGILLGGLGIFQLASIYLVGLKGQGTTGGTLPTFGVRLQQTMAGALAGGVSSLFGIGGGLVLVPLLVSMVKTPLKMAVRTSLGAVSIISCWAVLQHTFAGNVVWDLGLTLGIGTLVGAQIGTRLLPHLPEVWVKVGFQGLLVVLAGTTFFEAVQRWR